MFYCLLLKLNDFSFQDKSFNKLKVSLNEMVFENDEDSFTKEVKNFNIQRIVDNDSEILLYIKEGEDVEHYIEYLLDEEFELVEHDLKVSYEDKNIEYNMSFVGNFLEEDLNRDIMDMLLSGVNKKHILGIRGLKQNHPNMFGNNLEQPSYKKMAKNIVKEVLNICDSYAFDDINYIVTSANLGFDTVAFFAIQYLKKHHLPNIKSVLTIPYRDINLSKDWNKTDCERFERMKSLADVIIYVDEDIPKYFTNIIAKGKPHPYKLNQNNYLISDISSMVLTNGKNDDSLSDFMDYCIINGNAIFEMEQK